MSFSSIKSYDNNWNGGVCSSCGANLKTYLILMENAEPRTASTLRFCGNYSGKNYLYQSDFSDTLDPAYYYSRDTSVSTLSIDTENTYDGYPSLRIVNKAAGSSGKDLAIQTLTNQCRDNDGIGDSKSMTLSFWAKSSVDGNTFCVRWGFQSDYVTVKLTKDWAFYSVSLPKTTANNNYMHPYIGKTGTVWMAKMQLEDGTTATDFVPEPQGVYAATETTIGQPCHFPEAPTREGYTFDGWYTAVSGGTKSGCSHGCRGL